MGFRIDISKVKQLGKGIEDPDREEFLNLIDDWCERVEVGARRHCNDPQGKTIAFYREKMAVKVEAPGSALIDCLMQAMVEHRNAMDTSLAGVYEVVIADLEDRRERTLRSRKR